MPPDDESPPDDDQDVVEAAIDTGVRNQRLLVHGWFASHADSGIPGPHVRLKTNDRRDPVLKTNQIPELVVALNSVADRIERRWNAEGASFLEATDFANAPDPNDPDVNRLSRIKRLEFVDLVAASDTQGIALLVQAENTTEAMDSIARLLGVSDVDVLVGLDGLDKFSLFSLTNGSKKARAETLTRLRAT